MSYFFDYRFSALDNLREWLAIAIREGHAGTVGAIARDIVRVSRAVLAETKEVSMEQASRIDSPAVADLIQEQWTPGEWGFSKEIGRHLFRPNGPEFVLEDFTRMVGSEWVAG